MGDGNENLFFIGQVLQLLVPQSVSHPIGPTSISEGKKVIDIDFPRFSPGLPFYAIVLEIPYQFLCLTDHRNDGVALLLKLLALLFDVVKLSISIGMRDTLDLLFIGTQ